MPRQSVLIVDAGREPMHVLASRVNRLGYRVARAKTSEAALEAVQDSRLGVGAVIIPPDLPVIDLPRSLCALRDAAAGSLPILASGSRPTRETAHGLRIAGVDFPVFEPIDAHTLRFQLNRALYTEDSRGRARRAPRVPAAWPVDVQMGRRTKETRAYSISIHGVFLTTPKPAVRRTTLRLSLPIPGCSVKVAGRVVMTNVPGNLLKRNLPLGMAVEFTGLDEQSELAIAVFAEERMRALEF